MAGVTEVDFQRLIALVEHQTEQLDKLYRAVMGNGNPRDSHRDRLSALEHWRVGVAEPRLKEHEKAVKDYRTLKTRIYASWAAFTFMLGIVIVIGFKIIDLLQP